MCSAVEIHADSLASPHDIRPCLGGPRNCFQGSKLARKSAKPYCPGRPGSGKQAAARHQPSPPLINPVDMARWSAQAVQITAAWARRGFSLQWPTTPLVQLSAAQSQQRLLQLASPAECNGRADTSHKTWHLPANACNHSTLCCDAHHPSEGATCTRLR